MRLVLGGLTLLTGCGTRAAGLTPAQHQLLLAIIGQTTPAARQLAPIAHFAVACG
ncbi:MAG: hypothetical protein IMZ75_16105 [Actinobacteria bacterium]|nr:hypothetical protein [Actinomycetota bacterium]